MRDVCIRRASPPGGARTFAAVLAIGLIGSLSACGGSKSPSSHTSTVSAATSSICRPLARTLVALADHVPAARVTAVAQTGNNGAPQCRVAAPGMLVEINADSSPQRYARLERAIVEAGQQFGTQRRSRPRGQCPTSGSTPHGCPISTSC